ncbi:carboxymuconolactone decarboxylase family protein [Chengkuizengella axinellae]|uniref:Carboxymuconolactone decarboxylase family protein n=1 Tax=Chengkuizengella axinellae TaxID=3064388 RepID=A0ABT9IZJ5_9BACL|nr:carboxymuconolactone decarboxylase family protein [Chengkuizengella sp. 2205SS18-9]MDP5274778.1 carboxymuconolactone decarboxylase family protein [Chengkuizengella sp. 2205SS18-9]
MSQRLQIEQGLYKAMMGLEGYLSESTVSKSLIELIKMRSSQINGCAFCMDMHAKDALKGGESSQRLYVLSAWRETAFFTDEEKAVLALTEAATHMNDHEKLDKAFEEASLYFDSKQLNDILAAIVTINGWNRIAITAKMPIEKQS